MDIDIDTDEYEYDPAETKKLLAKALRKSRKHRGPLASVWHQLNLMIGVVADWTTGRYRDIPYATIITLILGITYFVLPVDSVPDFIPGVGFLDDITVLSYIGYAVSRDLERYHRWKERESGDESGPE